MARTITISLGEVTCTAVLHDDAPAMGGLLWDALPLTGELRHVRWSGEAGYLLAAALRDTSPPDERRVSMYGPGQIVLRPEHAELNIGYGQGQPRDGFTRAAEVCHVASVVTNREAFLLRVAETRRVGRIPIEIRRKEDE